MFSPVPHRPTIEPLEARIAPAGIADAQFLPASVGGYTIVNAGQGLGTAGSNSGTYLLYVEKGTAVVFTTDLNNNGTVDPNEITGIAAGDGLRLISFVDIHGDIVTNLDRDTTLSDSNNNSTGDDPILRGDGRVLNNSTIESIVMRSLTAADLNDQNGDGTVDDRDVTLRLALSSYSIFGQILAGKGFGVAGDATSGLVIDTAGTALQQVAFQGQGIDFFAGANPTIGSIRTGTAASFEYFSFGMSNRDDIQGVLAQFTAPAGQVGGDIVGIRAATPTTTFNIDALIAGVGGVGARGGHIQDVTLNGDSASGYRVIAGDGGSGPNGGAGGSVVNFADLGSATGRVEIRAGNGGTASTGAGGSAGSVSLGTFNVNGGISIILGDGGDGFTAGGNGASLTRAVITTPEGGTDVPLTIVSSTRDVGHDPFTGRLLNFSTETGGYTSTEIGRKNVIDFDRDGFGDVVFTNNVPDQLVVMFGDGFGGFRTDRLYLDGPNTPEAVTVADFNGDGFMDIAAASNSPTNNGGIVVFLARTEDRNADGQLGQAEDLDRDGVVDFAGFRSALYSPLLSMNSGDPDGGLNVAFAYGGYRSAVAINDIEAGDFDGDGFMDLAVAASVIVPTTNGPAPLQHIIFLKGDMENGRPTGQFYADVGTKAAGEPPAGANPLVPFEFFALGNKMVIEATAMSSNGTHDVIVAGQVGAGAISRSIFVVDNSAPSIFGPFTIATTLGAVDTNRNLGPNAFSRADAEVKELTVLDQNNDGLADFAVTITQPGLVVSKLGNGLTFPFFITNNGIDNAGLFFGNPNGFGESTSLVGLRGTDGDGDGRFDQLAVYNGDSEVYIVELDDFDPGGVVANPGGVLLSVLAVFDFTPGNAVLDTAGDAFDIWIVDAAAPSVVDYIGTQVDEFISTTRFTFIDIAEHFINISAGDGGDALIGRGGTGGSIGSTLTRTSGIDPITGLPGTIITGALNITLPANPDNDGILTLAAGNGGNGLTAGGNGGDVRGTTVRYAAGTTIFHTPSFLVGGNGGFGVSSAGGQGGSLVNNSIELGTSFTAGDGGRGQTGGNGGSIIGNGLSSGNTRVYDSRDLDMTLVAGDGGEGVRRGGNGGNITNFAGFFDLNTVAAAVGVLSHTAGNGGNAVSGPGGKGGSVTNSSPVTGQNNLAGDIVLQGGRGGNGTTGGDGGSVSTFLNRPGQTINPAVLSIIGGDGGSGVAGVGGRGGSVTGIETPSVGKPNAIAGQATPYSFNRILGGNGGDSSGGTGGVGGGIANIKTSNSDNPFVLAAGAGGIGLIRGGAGGSVRDAQVEVGGESLAKLLVIAGAGGGATAFTANPLDTNIVNQADKAFGGRVGTGGDGGSIVNFIQGVRNANGQIGGNLSGRVDLIAGNGGDTLNFGTVANDRVPVGKGGSISNVFVAGSIGNIAQNVPIKSYNRELAGETIGDFVNANLRDPLLPGSFDDSIGLVGAVVGASGRLKEVALNFGGGEVVFVSQPSTGGINGSASSVTARNIMSMVAGSVERIASIQSIAFINVVGTGDVGSVKNPLDVLYRDKDGNPIPEPVLDGRLDDGALIYKRLAGGRLPNGKVFQLA